VITMFICYAVGTITGIWLSRTYWMTKGASKLYDIMNEKRLLKNDEA